MVHYYKDFGMRRSEEPVFSPEWDVIIQKYREDLAYGRIVPEIWNMDGFLGEGITMR